jgi:hypothetical protein
MRLLRQLFSYPAAIAAKDHHCWLHSHYHAFTMTPLLLLLCAVSVGAESALPAQLPPPLHWLRHPTCSTCTQMTICNIESKRSH